MEDKLWERSRLVEKILASRLRKISSNEKSEEENKTEKKPEHPKNRDATGRITKSSDQGDVTEIEEFFIKFKNVSYIHCEWCTAEELEVGDSTIVTSIKKFKACQIDRDDINLDCFKIDRVLHEAVRMESTAEARTYYLVKWKSLPYEESTWELLKDVDQEKIDEFHRLRQVPSETARIFKAQPNANEWKKLDSPFCKDNKLKDYQQTGVDWLTQSYCNKRSCILADEMGLGKTVQTVIFLREVFKLGVHGPFLIVAPLSTINLWEREFQCWTDLKIIVYHGAKQSRKIIQEHEMYYKDENGVPIPGVYRFHALITTYEMLMVDCDILSAILWRVLVLDEGHRLKNTNSKLYEKITTIKTEHKVLLSGTPLQNCLEELFVILHFLDPETFASAELFLKEFGDIQELKQLDKLTKVLKPVLLRRLKEDVHVTTKNRMDTPMEADADKTQHRNRYPEKLSSETTTNASNTGDVKERQGYLGDLSTKSREELIELLRRQEKVTSNQDLVRHLPDKGAKIQKMVTRIKQLLDRFMQVDDTAALFEKMAIQSEHSRINRSQQRSTIDDDEEEDEEVKVLKKMAQRTDEDKMVVDERKEDPHASKFTNSYENVIKKAEKSQAKKEPKGKFRPYKTVRTHDVQELSDKMGSLNFLKDVVSLDKGDTASEADKRILADKNEGSDQVLSQSSVSENESLMEKGQGVSDEKYSTQKVQFNEKNSSSSVCDYDKDKSKRRLKYKYDENLETPLTAGTSHCKASMMISIEESVSIQKEQERHIQEIQAKHAADKLAQRLHVKMADFNPEGFATERYRDRGEYSHENSDSDDEDDIDYPD